MRTIYFLTSVIYQVSSLIAIYLYNKDNKLLFKVHFIFKWQRGSPGLPIWCFEKHKPCTMPPQWVSFLYFLSICAVCGDSGGGIPFSFLSCQFPSVLLIITFRRNDFFISCFVVKSWLDISSFPSSLWKGG